MADDISKGAFGPGVKPYTAADSAGWQQRHRAHMSLGSPYASGGSAPPIRARPSAPSAPGGMGPQAPKPGQALGGPSGRGRGGMPINAGDVLGGLTRESKFTSNAGSADGNRGVQDLVAANTASSRSSAARGLQTTNAQLDMQDQANRSSAYQQNLSNQARINADLAQRENSQIGLATQLQQQMIQNRLTLALSLMQG